MRDPINFCKYLFFPQFLEMAGSFLDGIQFQKFKWSSDQLPKHLQIGTVTSHRGPETAYRIFGQPENRLTDSWIFRKDLCCHLECNFTGRRYRLYFCQGFKIIAKRIFNEQLSL